MNVERIIVEQKSNHIPRTNYKFPPRTSIPATLNFSYGPEFVHALATSNNFAIVDRANCSNRTNQNSLVKPNSILSSRDQLNKNSLKLALRTATGNVAYSSNIDLGKRLLDAARDGRTDRVRQLVVTSGAPFTSDWLGTTALHLASQNGHIEIASILLSAGVNKDARTKLERTALHLAAQNGSLEIVSLLLDHGSDINARDMLRMTPLHWAVERGHPEVIKRLLISGADIFAKSKFFLTPLDIARNSRYLEVIELFKDLFKSSEICRLNQQLLSLTSTNGPSNELSSIGIDLERDGVINDQQVSTKIQTHDKSLDVNYYLKLDDDASEYGTSSDVVTDQTCASNLVNEQCLDMVELEWSNLNLESDLFLTSDDSNEPKVEYLMKVVGELQRENRQLRQRVEELSKPPPPKKLNLLF